MNLRSKLAFFIALNNYVEMIVNGVAPLSLPRAKAKPITKLTAFGGTEQRNLPDGYIQRQFIYMMDGSYVDTGIVPDNTGKIEIDFQTTSVQTRNTIYFGARTNTSTGAGVTAAHTNIAEGAFYAFGQRFSPTQTFANNTRYLISYDNGTIVWKSGSTVIYTNTSTPTDTTTHSLYINALNNAGTVYGNYEGIYLYSFKVWNAQGVLVADYVPAVQKGAVPVVGFYDTVSGTFKTATAGTFAAGGEAVPTPDTPMDIVSNNGVLKARHASGLPLGYTLLDYIESSGTQYIDTGITNENCDTYGVKTKYYYTAVTAGSSLCGNYEQNTGKASFGQIFVSAAHTADAIFTGIGNVSTCARPNVPEQTDLTDEFTINCTAGTISRNFNGESLFSSGLDFSVRSSRHCLLFAYNSSSGAMQYTKARISYFQILKDNVLVFNGIPAKNSSNVIGMYDTVSGQFFTNAGTGDFVAGTAVSDPVEVYADGTVETINIHSKNLFDKAEQSTDYFYNNYGTESSVSLSGVKFVHSAKIPCKPNTRYVLSGTRNLSGDPYNYKFTFWDKNGNFISYENPSDQVYQGDYSRDTTTPNNCYYIAFNSFANDTNVQLEQGSTATTYEPYYDGGTATAEMLLSLGDYTDEQEIISGAVTRKMGVKVLDGTEDWELQNASRSVFVIKTLFPADFASNPDNNIGFCTHFTVVARSTTVSSVLEDGQMGWNTNGYLVMRHLASLAEVANFKQYLADQYAAGTPVIIVYPLATETTDTVTGQPMNTTAGDNILEITQASLDGLELECRYFKGK